MNLTLRVRDTRGVAANFYAADRTVQREARKLVRDKGLFTKELTQFFAPKDTWFMTNNVRLVMSADGLSFQVGWFAGDFSAAGLPFYPPFQEYGTYKMRAQPSLHPAYRQAEQIFRRDTKEMYRRAMTRATKRRR